MSAESEGRDAAREFRREHGLGVQPIGDLVTLIEQSTGIDVAVLDAGPDEHGLTMRDPIRGAVFIAVARTPHPMRQRSTLAHELAHVLFEDWDDEPASHSGAPAESRANSFARHLLVPVDGLGLVVDNGPADLSTLSRVVQLFEVSPVIAAIALHQAGQIGVALKDQWMKGESTQRLATRFGWSDHYQALKMRSDTRRAPQKLVARSIVGYVDNVVSAQTIATLRGIDADEIVRSLAADGIEPQQVADQWAEAEQLPDVKVDFGDWPDDVSEDFS
ncbi:ImmA/IrrE family metallo-endopeptidase [Rhodococcoides fascians]|uniref:ImmA/IrrE family metallo-endopeptidase n=1 Tax=Rhodococcoides fascians TaxID=1828 RepID=UPI00050C16F7|nr:ImmA/IrrE family metallo-endopeptidase [Rhodococcus fascians]